MKKRSQVRAFGCPRPSCLLSSCGRLQFSAKKKRKNEKEPSEKRASLPLDEDRRAGRVCCQTFSSGLRTFARAFIWATQKVSFDTFRILKRNCSRLAFVLTTMRVDTILHRATPSRVLCLGLCRGSRGVRGAPRPFLSLSLVGGTRPRAFAASWGNSPDSIDREGHPCERNRARGRSSRRSASYILRQ